MAAEEDGSRGRWQQRKFTAEEDHSRGRSQQRKITAEEDYTRGRSLFKSKGKRVRILNTDF